MIIKALAHMDDAGRTVKTIQNYTGSASARAW